MDGEVLADELGHDGAGAGPGLDRLAIPGVLGLVHLLEQPLDDVRALLQRSSHGSPVPDPSGSLTPRSGAMKSRRRIRSIAMDPTAGPVAAPRAWRPAEDIRGAAGRPDQTLSWPYRTL